MSRALDKTLEAAERILDNQIWKDGVERPTYCPDCGGLLREGCDVVERKTINLFGEPTNVRVDLCGHECATPPTKEQEEQWAMHPAWLADMLWEKDEAGIHTGRYLSPDKKEWMEGQFRLFDEVYRLRGLVWCLAKEVKPNAVDRAVSAQT